MESSSLQSSAIDPACFLTGESPAMQRLRTQLRHVSPHLRIALLIGEPGTGKEQVARTLHRLAGRTETDDAFVPIAHASDLREAAQRVVPGQTLFVPKLTQLSADQQRRLSQTLLRLESTHRGRRRPQLIFASASDLRGLVSAGLFHVELYRKVSSVTIHLPPLRSRREDIPAILSALVSPLTVDQVFDSRAMGRLQGHHWPGNIRELAHIARCAFQTGHPNALAGRCDILPALSREMDTAMVEDGAGPSATIPTERLDHVVQNHVVDVLLRCSGNKLRAAERLGISRSTLYRMLEANPSLNEHGES